MEIKNISTHVATNYGGVAGKFKELWATQISLIRQKFGDQIEQIWLPDQELTDVPILWVKKGTIAEVLLFMKTEAGFEYRMLSDLTATDESPETPRFHVVYQLFSPTKMNRIRIKVKVAENESIPTATKVWPAADWLEREVWDMFGIKFEGHPDLRRILMDMRWQGHPLRKDYPLRGYQIFPTPEPIEEALLKGGR